MGRAVVAPTEDRVAIVVEIEDSTPDGIKLVKGVPVLEVPEYENDAFEKTLKDNLGVFIKGLVSVTRYDLTTPAGERTATVYQMVSIVRTDLLEGGCKMALYPKEPPPGASMVLASDYRPGARFEFRIGTSSTQWKEGLPFGPTLCLGLPQPQVR
jgi:hypothetical protein